MQPSKTLLQAIAVAAELTGTQMSEPAARVMAEDLARYPEPHVLAALTRCRRELKGRLTIADVLTRIDDGRPGPEEAWSMIPKDIALDGCYIVDDDGKKRWRPAESPTVVWTDEMAAAFGVASPLLQEGDTIAARMAFLERYRTLCRDARDAGKPTHWTPSLGHDVAGREPALLEAARLGRLTRDHVAKLLPYRQAPAPEVAALLPDLTPTGARRSLKAAIDEAKKQRDGAPA